MGKRNKRKSYGICGVLGCGQISYLPSENFDESHGICERHATEQVLNDLVEELRKEPRIVLSSYMGHVSRTALDSAALEGALNRAQTRLRSLHAMS